MKRPSLGDRSYDASDLATRFNQKVTAASDCELPDYDFTFARGRIGQLMRKHEVSGEDMLTLIDNYISANRLKWKKGQQHHPIRLFVYGEVFKELLATLRNRQARVDVDPEESQVTWVPKRFRQGAN